MYPMASIRLNNNDIKALIREAVERLYEEQWYEVEPLCRLPYFVSVAFSDHAIDREDERDISRDDVIENLRTAVRSILDDYQKREIREGDYIKVIDRSTCLVSVCALEPTFNKKRVHKVVVVTCYFWDGKVNIDNGHNYYINDESPRYREAMEWNEENQDKVKEYTDWKRYGDERAIKKQQMKAEKEYYWRNHSEEPSSEKRMNRLNQAYMRKEKGDKYRIHDQLPDGDLKAIQDYFRDMNNKRIELEPIYEAVREGIKEALQRSLGRNTKKNIH